MKNHFFQCWMMSVTLGLGLVLPAVGADTYTWDGTTNSWNSAHWKNTGGTLVAPAYGNTLAGAETARITSGKVSNGSEMTINGKLFLDGGELNVTASLWNVGNGSGTVASELVVNGGTLTGTGKLIVARGGSTNSRLTVKSGSASIANLAITSGGTNQGTISVEGGSLRVTNEFRVSQNSVGVFDVTGGSVSVAKFYGAYGSTSGEKPTGTTTISNSTLTVTNEFNAAIVSGGDYAQGTVTLNEGGILLSNGNSYDTSIARNANANGKLVVNAGGKYVAGDDSVGYLYVAYNTAGETAKNTGELVINEGGSVNLKRLIVAREDNAEGKITVHGGNLTVTGDTTFAHTGKATASLLATGGDLNFKGNVVLANSANSTASLLATGGDLNFEGNVVLANSANSTASFAMTGGNVEMKNFQFCSATADSEKYVANVVISGGTLATTGNFDTQASRYDLALVGSDYQIDITGYISFSDKASADSTTHFMFADRGIGSIKAANVGRVRNSVDLGIASGVTRLDGSSWKLMEASNLTSTATVKDASLWSLSTPGTTYTATLNNALKASDTPIQLGFLSNVITFDDPFSKGWLNVLGDNSSEPMAFWLQMTNDGNTAVTLDDLALWMNGEDEDLPTYHSLNASVDEAAGALILPDFGSMGDYVLGWDFADFNTKYGTNFAVSGVWATHVPEPATAWLLLLGLWGLFRGKRKA